MDMRGIRTSVQTQHNIVVSYWLDNVCHSPRCARSGQVIDSGMMSVRNFVPPPPPPPRFESAPLRLWAWGVSLHCGIAETPATHACPSTLMWTPPHSQYVLCDFSLTERTQIQLHLYLDNFNSNMCRHKKKFWCFFFRCHSFGSTWPPREVAFHL